MTTLVAHAGTQPDRLNNATGILSFGILMYFVLLGIFPLIAKRIIEDVKRRKAFAGWHKPQTSHTWRRA